MLRKTTGFQEDSAITNDDPEYNPRDDEVNDEGEINDYVVEKTVKVQSLSCLEGWDYFYDLYLLMLFVYLRSNVVFLAVHMRH